MKLTLLAMLLCLSSPASGQGEAEHHLNTARHFMKNGWHEDARHELRAAAETSEGSKDHEVFWLLAQVCYELLDIAGGLEAAGQAARLAPTAEERGAAEDLERYLSSSFGALVVEGPHRGIWSRLQVEPATPIRDPELRSFAGRVALKLKEKSELPVRAWLPAGTWLVNGRQVELAPMEEQRLTLPMAALGHRGLAALQVLRIELSPGFQVLMGTDVGHMLPTPVGELALVQPAGPVLISLVGRAARTTWMVDGYPRDAALSWTAGARVGTELFMDGSLAFRPFIGYRHGVLAGIATPCREIQGTTTCGPSITAPTSTLHAAARVHVPHVDLAVDWRDGGRVNALGVGVRIGADWILGRVPGEVQASAPSDARFTAEVDGRSVRAWGISMLASLSLAL